MKTELSKKQIQEFFKQKNFDKVLELGQDYVYDQNEDKDVLYWLAKSAIATQKYSDAEYFSIWLKGLDLESTAPLFLLGSTKILQEDYRMAQSYYEMILSLEKDNPIAIAAIGNLLYLRGFYTDATKQYSNAIVAGLSSKITPQEYALIIYKACTSFLENGEEEEGLEFIDKNKLDEFQEMTWLAKRKLYNNLQNTTEFLACTEVLQQNVPTQPEYIIDLLQHIGYSSEDGDKAIDFYGRLLLLELDEDQKKQAFLGRAERYIEKEDWQAALSDFDALLTISEDWFTYSRRAFVYEQLKKIKQALKDINAAMSLVPTPSKSLYITRGILLSKVKLYDKAIDDLTKALKLANDADPNILYQLGIVYNKKGDTLNAFKTLVKAEMAGSTKARELLHKKFSQKLIQIGAQQSSKFATKFEAEIPRNKRSPILNALFEKIWIPNMERFFQTIEDDLDVYPASIIKTVIEEAAKDLFLITPKGILFIEGSNKKNLEAFYKVDLESEHAILLEIQPAKGGEVSTMRLSLFEDNLLVSYPIGEAEVAPKYFICAEVLNEAQKEQLTTKTLDVDYMDSIEQAIADKL